MLLSATFLAGCLGESEDDDPLVQRQVGIVTDPSDFSYMNNTTATAHIHDYWGSKERLGILDGPVPAGSFLYGASDGYALYPKRPPEGNIIPLGTQTVEVTVHWNETYRLSDDPPELWVQTAADDEPYSYAQLQNGETVTVTTTNEQNDIPHQRLSAWTFYVALPMGVELPNGAKYDSHQIQIHMHVEAVRGLEIPAYPAHPDLWHNETTLPLLEEQRGYQWVDRMRPGWYQGGGCNSCFGHTQIAPGGGLLVPFDADHVRIQVSHYSETGRDLRIIYHGADTWNWTDAPLHTEDGGKRTYIIPVEKRGDSPYALQSLWRFAWYLEGEGPYADRGSFELTATVHKEPLEESQ